ncbi:hypothetical protein HAX54_031809 [Datura stramonium]|uniref:Uncharacterized protein n=1 Tax=Datura stramonium TaxID=4076 RepID=A0ABS8VB15_DATST|nr:hypothetical protein [Datura stramonium]
MFPGKKLQVQWVKTSRACDNCIRKRARWYCPADDAFLCRTVIAVSPSGEPLARRHERSSLGFIISLASVSVPSWHRGFTRKARTPRQGRKASKFAGDEKEVIILKNPIHLPEILPMRIRRWRMKRSNFCTVCPYSISWPSRSSATRNNHEMMRITRLQQQMQIQNLNLINLRRQRCRMMSPMLRVYWGKVLMTSHLIWRIRLLGVCNNEEENSMECSMVSHEKAKIEDEGEVDHTHHDIDINGDTFEFKFNYDSPTIILPEKMK